MHYRHVHARHTMPRSFPIQNTAILYLLLHRFNANGWVWLIAAVWMAWRWFDALLDILSETEMDVL